ncbi:MAG: hypothetical protein PHT07_07635 [Paludibacter sp.]|nr:hypothetical protein [Paludibacter sp.]
MNTNYLEVFGGLPSNLKIIINKINDESIELIYPKKKFSFATIYSIIMSLAFIGFTGFWTYLSFQGPFFLPFFSIPFWIAGVKLLIGVIVFTFETQTLTVCKSSIIFKRELFGSKKITELKIENIQSVYLECLSSNIFTMLKSYRLLFLFQTRQRKGTITLPAIESYGEPIFFFENVSEDEQELITNTLDNFIRQVKTT